MSRISLGNLWSIWMLAAIRRIGYLQCLFWPGFKLYASLALPFTVLCACLYLGVEDWFYLHSHVHSFIWFFHARTPEEVFAARGVKPTLSPNLNTLALVEVISISLSPTLFWLIFFIFLSYFIDMRHQGGPLINMSEECIRTLTRQWE